ncbi:MAG: FAD-dependent oxidoreductase [Kiloniellales bacterium]|nr:FAD-dependent oxidoreductase [Kiloniellales bacterium]
MKIAIIGGGISGLATAHKLLELNDGLGEDERYEVTLFEEDDHLGGNAHTAQVSLGIDESGKPFSRWADLGVNDFNHDTYKRIVNIMEQIGFEYEKDYRLLEDTACFYTLDGGIQYTIDGAWGTKMPASLDDEFERFRRAAVEDFEKKEFRDKSVKDYLSEKDFSEDLGRLVLYPRINGMYFVDETGPGDMPLSAVMHYYIIQEGWREKGQNADENPKRMYFVDGVGEFIRKLTAHIQGMGATVVTGFRGAVAARPGDEGVEVYDAAQGSTALAQRFDRVVLACHADDALRCLKQGASDEMVQILSSIKYLNSLSVCHTFAGVLPPNRNAWRTYNILIHQPPNKAMKPYTITYVCNRHQNDKTNADYDKFGLPQFFVTLNPPVPIPDQFVLKQVEETSWFKKEDPAVTYLKHNVLNFDCLEAQMLLWDKDKKVQGTNNLYFTGGWTNGAGLMEECWRSGSCVAELIHDPTYECEDIYNFDPQAEHFAPRYLRDAASAKG